MERVNLSPFPLHFLILSPFSRSPATRLQPGSKRSVQIDSCDCVFFPIFRIQHTPVEGWLAGAGISSQFSSDKEDPALCFVCGEATSTVRDKD